MVTQVIQPQINSNEITPGQTFTVNVNYLTENPANENTVGINVTFFYNSNELELVGEPTYTTAPLLKTGVDDTTNLDKDIETTKAFLSQFVSPQATFAPQSPLMTLNFKALDAFNGTNINFSADTSQNGATVSTSNLSLTEKTDPVNPPPTFEGPTSFSIEENLFAVTTLTATDPNGDSLTYAFSGGADQSFFSIDGSTGALRFSTAPDFENPTDADTNNQYQVQVSVSDGVNPAVTQDLTVTVNDVQDTNPAPTITSPNSVSIPENVTSVMTVVAEDPNFELLTYTISGGEDSSFFDINSETGALSFKDAPDFENPSDRGFNNQYKVQVSAFDSEQSTSQELTVIVTDQEPETNPANFNTRLTRFQNSARPGTYLFAGPEESESIRTNFPNFIEEGYAFTVASEPADGLIRINRFQNMAILGTYLFAGEEESVGIRANFPNYIEEGIAFYVYDSDANIATDFYRFQNSDLLGTYIFVGNAERENIVANFPSFVEEGAAFEVVV